MVDANMSRRAARRKPRRGHGFNGVGLTPRALAAITLTYSPEPCYNAQTANFPRDGAANDQAKESNPQPVVFLAWDLVLLTAAHLGLGAYFVRFNSGFFGVHKETLILASA